MQSPPEPFQEVVDRFIAWAQNCRDIRAAQIVGSWARGDGNPLWSDIDINFYTTRPLNYRRDWRWIDTIMPTWIVGPDDTSTRFPRWLTRPFSSWTLFTTLEGGIAVDFFIGSAWRLLWRDMTRTLRETTPPLPVTILFDKGGRLARTGAVPFTVPQSIKTPDAARFAYVLQDFWGAADRAVRKLGRGDLYDAKHICDIGMKNQLMPLLLWQHAVQHGWDHSPPYRYRFPENWADPRATEVFPQLYAHYDPADIARAVRAQCNLARDLAPEIAAALGYAYPAANIATLHAWIEGALDQIEAEI